MANGDPGQSAGNIVGGEGQSEKLARAGTHEADRQVQIGLLGIDHDGCGAEGADAFNEFEGIFRVAVEVNDDDIVMLLEHAGQIVEAIWIGSKLRDLRANEGAYSGVPSGQRGLTGPGRATTFGASRGGSPVVVT